MALSVALMLGIAGTVYAANAVAWDAGYPTTKAGEITGQGTYTTDPGWSVTSATMTAIPTGGGAGYSASGTPANGKWGPYTVKNLPKGQYNVTIGIGYKKAPGSMVIYGPTSIVNVP